MTGWMQSLRFSFFNNSSIAIVASFVALILPAVRYAPRSFSFSIIEPSLKAKAILAIGWSSLLVSSYSK